MPTMRRSPPRRRHGIQRWPRRQLQKVNRALDELEARQMLQTTQQAVAGAPPAHAAPMDACEWRRPVHLCAMPPPAVCGNGGRGVVRVCVWWWWVGGVSVCVCGGVCVG